MLPLLCQSATGVSTAGARMSGRRVCPRLPTDIAPERGEPLVLLFQEHRAGSASCCGAVGQEADDGRAVPHRPVPPLHGVGGGDWPPMFRRTVQEGQRVVSPVPQRGGRLRKPAPEALRHLGERPGSHVESAGLRGLTRPKPPRSGDDRRLRAPFWPSSRTNNSRSGGLHYDGSMRNTGCAGARPQAVARGARCARRPRRRAPAT
jgi:hypothetical protein